MESRRTFFRRFVWITTFTLAFIATSIASADTQSKDINEEKVGQSQLIGTWRLVSMKVDGVDRTTPDVFITLKHITPEGFVWLSHDKSTGRIVRAAGGTYTLSGNMYTERIEYGIGSDYEVIKASQHSFTARIAGDIWYHVGYLANGQTIDEVWERVKSQ
jgi:hypothetical protein